MNQFINRLKIIFIALFFISVGGVFVYHAFWVWPKQRCEAKGWWWEPKDRQCAVPVPLSVITGRPSKAPAPAGPVAPASPRP